MLVGSAGTGKTVLMQDKLNNLSDDFMVANVPFNFYTSSDMLQVYDYYGVVLFFYNCIFYI